VFGIVLAALYVLRDILVAVLVFFDRIIIGVTNGCLRKDLDYVLDPSWKAQVHQTPLLASELEAFLTQGIPKARKADLVATLDCVVAARKVFENAMPYLPRDHRHYVVVKLPSLIDVIGTDDSKIKLGLNDHDVGLIRDRLKMIPDRSLGEYQQSSRRLVADKMGANRILQRIRDASLLSETESDAKSTQADAFTSYQARLNAIVQKLTPSYHLQDSPDEAEVSFSLFLQALQPVCGRRIVHSVPVPAFFSPTSSIHLSPLNEKKDEADFSEYLT
jgi:hypothetical protein